jgi:LysR family nitrogen assimilation transcriptional regulator
VSVGLPVSCASIMTMPLLRTVRARYPHILLQISENLSGLLGELILNNRLDMALLYGTHGSEGLTRRPLLIERLCLVSQPALTPTASAGDALPVSALADVPLVLPSHSNGLRALVDAAFSRHGLKPLIVAEIDSLPSLRASAELGLAATILPRSAATGSDTKTLLICDIVEPEIERTIVLCQPSAPPSSEPVEAIASTMVEIVDELVETGNWPGVRSV